jgi:hypothetical protein
MCAGLKDDDERAQKLDATSTIITRVQDIENVCAGKRK